MTFALVMGALSALELAAVALLVRRARRRAAAVGTPVRVCGHSSCPGSEDDAEFPALVCDLPAGHEGMHRQSGHNVAWDRPDPPAGSILEDVIANALADMYAFQRQNFRAPETFGISAEADAALRAMWKRDLERSMPAAEAERFIASHAAGPLRLYGIRVEVRENLSGAEVAVA